MTGAQRAGSGALGGLGRSSGPALLILASLADGAKHGYALTKDIESFAGVGHHLALADLQPGDRVVDLGSGSGTDAFLPPPHVGAAAPAAGAALSPSSRPPWSV